MLLISTIPLRSGDLRNKIVVYSWSHLGQLRNSGSFCVGQVPRMSHVATRPKKHTCERCICPSLSRPFAAGPASSLFVVIQNVLDVIRKSGTTVRGNSFSGFPPLFFVFVGWFFKKIYRVYTRANNVDCCCLPYS